jgi:hypothetical protein
MSSRGQHAGAGAAPGGHGLRHPGRLSADGRPRHHPLCMNTARTFHNGGIAMVFDWAAASNQPTTLTFDPVRRGSQR